MSIFQTIECWQSKGWTVSKEDFWKMSIFMKCTKHLLQIWLQKDMLRKQATMENQEKDSTYHTLPWGCLECIPPPWQKKAEKILFLGLNLKNWGWGDGLNFQRGRGELNYQRGEGGGLDSWGIPCFSVNMLFLWQYCLIHITNSGSSDISDCFYVAVGYLKIKI